MGKINIFLGGGVELLEGKGGYRSVVNDSVADVHADMDNSDNTFVVKTFNDLTKHVVEGEKQMVYHKYIREESDIAIFIIDGSIGEITRGEMEIAYESFSNKGYPKIYIFGTNLSDDSDDVKFVNEISDYYNHFNTKDNLKHELYRELMKFKYQSKDRIELEHRIKVLNKKHDESGNKIKDLLVSIEAEKNNYNNLVKNLNQAEDELFKLNNVARNHEPFQPYSDDDEKSNERVKELESQINALNEEKQKLLSKIELLEKNVGEYKKNNEEISEELSGCEKEIVRLNDELSSANNENDVLKGCLDEKEKEKAELLKKIAAIEKELDSIRKEKELAEEKAKFQYKTILYKGIPIEMVAVKGGTFTMGATSEQGSDAYDSEKPAHSVTLSNYYIGKFEVTQELWQAVMGNNPSYFKGDKLPVEEVSWDDCWDFIMKLNQLTGANFRLPTEAEWEYAARGGNKSGGYKYSGSNNIGDVAWYTDNSGSKTHQVGTKSLNELGIYDMSGNVWEWCQDWYGSSSQMNPVGASSGSYRVIRGGSWYFDAQDCRVSNRGSNAPGYRYNDIGFRLAVSQ